MRLVTTARTTTEPRAEETRIFSPDRIRFARANDSGSSHHGSGASSFSHGTLRVTEPLHQCSVMLAVQSTSGNSFAEPTGCRPFTRGYFRIGLAWTRGCSAFATGLSTGS